MENQTLYYPELESSLEKQHRAILEEAKLKGGHYAKTNQPHLKGDALIHYVSDISAKYDEMSVMVRQRIQAENTAIDSQLMTDATDEKVKKLQEKRHGIQNEQHNLELEIAQKGINLDAIEPLRPLQNRKFLPLFGIIGISEIAFNATALQVTGDNLLFGLIISVGITLAMVLLAQFLGQHLKKSTAPNGQKALITAGATALALAVIYFLAKLRSQYMQEESQMEVSIIFLAAVNILFFAVTTWAFYKNATSEEEKQLYEEKKKVYDEKMKDKNKLESLKKQNTDLEKEIEQIKQDTAGQLKIIFHKPGYQKVSIQRLAKWKIEAIETFKAANLAHRSDRQAPDCFMQTIEPNEQYYQTTKSLNE